ncbi:hypothetical protein RYX36_022558 [Vicia faba]
MFQVYQSTIAVKAYAAEAENNDKVQFDVLPKAIESCYKVTLFLFNWFLQFTLYHYVRSGISIYAFYSCLEKGCDKKPTEIMSVGLLYSVECKKSRD